MKFDFKKKRLSFRAQRGISRRTPGIVCGIMPPHPPTAFSSFPHSVRNDGALFYTETAGWKTLRHLRRRAFAGGGVEELFAEAQALRGHFHVFVGGDVFQRTLQRHDEWWREADAFAVAGGAHVG